MQSQTQAQSLQQENEAPALTMKKFTTVVKMQKTAGDTSTAMLQQLLQTLGQLHRPIELLHLECRSNQDSANILLLTKCQTDDYEALISAIERLKAVTEIVQPGKDSAKPDIWFPRHISELDRCAKLVLWEDPEFSTDNPYFADTEFMKRRAQIEKIAFDFKQGDAIPRVEYTERETAVWKESYTQLHELYKTHACKQYLQGLQRLKSECGLGPEAIPQLEDLSRYLRRQSGFSLRPTAGLLSARDFLASLAFRVFRCTQYTRHHLNLHYSPDPDCIHEILGHIPLLTDRGIADFWQEIGLASLGATDEEIKSLASLFWFTFEYGLCKEGDETRAFGAALLSAFGELQQSLTDTSTHKEFDVNSAKATPYDIDKYQTLYFVGESMEFMLEEFRKYIAGMKKGFVTRFDPVTQKVILLDNRDSLQATCADIQSDLQRLQLALTEYL